MCVSTERAAKVGLAVHMAAGMRQYSAPWEEPCVLCLASDAGRMGSPLEETNLYALTDGASGYWLSPMVTGLNLVKNLKKEKIPQKGKKSLLGFFFLNTEFVSLFELYICTNHLKFEILKFHNLKS